MILLVDGTNNFIRTYTSFSTTTSNGDPFGGVFGFLVSLNSFVQLVQPTQIIVAFDAPGGSDRRRKIYAEYKEGRKPARLNRKFVIGDDNEEHNKKAQEQYLRAYLEDLPVSTVCIKGIEADDTIAYICNSNPDERKVIVSTDQDFHQLLNTKTMIYKPVKKTFYSQADLIRDTGIHACNFGLARAFVGDTSDNLDGVPGVGLKRLVSWIPQFTEPEQLELDDVLAFCGQQKHARYQRFAEHEQAVRRNYRLMQLRDPEISLASIRLVKNSIQEHPTMNSTAFRLKLMRDGLDIGDRFLCNFLKLSVAGKQTHNV